MSSSTSDDSSSRSSSPEEEAAPAAAPAAEEAAAAKPAPKRKRVTKVKPSPSLTRDLIVLSLTVGLGVVLDQRQVGAACSAILADPSIEELVQRLEEQISGPAGKKRRGDGEPKGKIKSAYNMFVSAVFDQLKAAGVSGVAMPDVGRVWQALPDDTRADITARFNAIQTPYNAAVKAGEGHGLGNALAAHDAKNKLQPIDYMGLYNRFKGAAAAAAAANGKPQAKPAKKAAAAAPTAAAAPAAAPPAAVAAAAAPAAEEQQLKKQKKEKKKDKEKKHKAEPEPEPAAPATEKKKHKKHKHDKVKQEDE